MNRDFEIFSQGGGGVPADLRGMLDWMTDKLDNDQIEIGQAVNAFCDLVRPGTSEDSHDVKPMWGGAMWAYGFGHVAAQVHGMYLNTMPWGFGFAIAMEEGFAFEALSDAAKEAVVKSLAIVLRMGGLNVEITEDNMIRVDMEDGTFNDINTDNIVGEFRREIDQELGPDAIRDPMKRWGL